MLLFRQQVRYTQRYFSFISLLFQIENEIAESLRQIQQNLEQIQRQKSQIMIQINTLKRFNKILEQENKNVQKSTHIPFQQPSITALNYDNLPCINYIMDKYGQPINLQSQINSNFVKVTQERLLKSNVQQQRILQQMEIQEQVNPMNQAQPKANINLSGLGGIFQAKNQFGSRILAPTNTGRFNDETANCKIMKFQTTQEINGDYMRVSDVQIAETKQCQQQILNTTKVNIYSQLAENMTPSLTQSRGFQQIPTYQVTFNRVLQEDSYLQKKMTNEVKIDEPVYAQVQINENQDLRLKRDNILEKYQQEQQQIIKLMQQNKINRLNQKIHSKYYKDLKYVKDNKNTSLYTNKQFSQLKPLLQVAVKNYGTLNYLQDAQLLQHCNKTNDYYKKMSFDDTQKLYQKIIEQSKQCDQI